MKNLIYRLGIYIIGVISVSLGIVLCVKCELGVSPISSVPYVLGYLTPLTFGTLTMLFHFCNSMIQYILEKKLINAKVLLQIPVAFLFGIIIDFFKNIMSFNAEDMIFKIFLMIMSIVCTALGMHLMLSMKLVQNPPDGTVNILAFLHDLKGFGIATILSAIFVGKTLTVMKIGRKKRGSTFQSSPVGSSSFLRQDTKIPPVVSFVCVRLAVHY